MLRQQAVGGGCCRKQGGQDRNSLRFSLLEGSGELGRPCLGKRLPQNVQFEELEGRHFSIPQNVLRPPQLIYYQDHGQENPRILIPLVSSPCGGWHQGAGSSGPDHPSATIRPSPAPFLSQPLSPSVSSSSNTNCLHGKSPSMTRFSTHKRKLWATDPTS